MASRVDETFRALLQGDLERYVEQTASLDEQGWNAFSELVGSAFHRAVGQRFLPGQDAGALGDFVADAGKPYQGTAVEIDAPAGVALMQSVLGDSSTVGPVLERFDEPDLARFELVLLRRLIADSGLEGEALTAFLDETRTEARPWTGEAETPKAGISLPEDEKTPTPASGI